MASYLLEIERFLYRVLRDDENPEENGLTAKNPDANESLENYVANGSRNMKSQYISCSNNLRSAKDFGNKKFQQPPFRIAILDRNKIESDDSITVYDVSDGGYGYDFTDSRAINFARFFGEVILQGHVPKEYVVSMEWHNYPPLFRVLRDDENPEEFGLTAKNPFANETLESHVLNGSKSWMPSQYISCSNNFESALEFGNNKFQHPPFRIAILDRNMIENDARITVYDVSDGGYGYDFTSRRAIHFAERFGKVILQGRIPKEYVVDVISRVSPW